MACVLSLRYLAMAGGWRVWLAYYPYYI